MTQQKHSVTFAMDDDLSEDMDESLPMFQKMPKLTRGFSLVPERLGKTLDDGSPNMFGWELLMRVLAYATAIISFPFSMVLCIKVIAQYERAVMFRLGRLITSGAKGPGMIFVLPCLDNFKVVDLRTHTFDVPTQEVLTKDSVTVAVNAVVYYRIFDPVMSIVNVEDANRSTRLLAQTTLRNVLGTVDLYQLLTCREQIANLMQGCLDAATDTWGVKVERVDVKDVRLPTQLQRAMAAEAEATRDANAKVIAAEGEQRASVALKAAALEIGECPIALQLRYLQTLCSISAEKNSTIIFPLPIELLTYFQSNWANEGERKGGIETPLHQRGGDRGERNSPSAPVMDFDDDEDPLPPPSPPLMVEKPFL